MDARVLVVNADAERDEFRLEIAFVSALSLVFLTCASRRLFAVNRSPVLQARNHLIPYDSKIVLSKAENEKRFS